MVQSPPTPHAVSAERTREALTDAALALFARDGFDTTTADRVAEQAGVSPRTFFRYFPTKESVVFHRDYGFMRSFATAYLEQPASASDYDAVRAPRSRHHSSSATAFATSGRVTTGVGMMRPS